jgi:hypothetical protein
MSVDILFSIYKAFFWSSEDMNDALNKRIINGFKLWDSQIGEQEKRGSTLDSDTLNIKEDMWKMSKWKISFWQIIWLRKRRKYPH